MRNHALNKKDLNVLNTKQRLVITQCWANRNPKGSKHHEHVHPNSIISGVMYFQINEKLPPISFAKDRQDSMKLDPIKYNHVNSESFMLPCKPGELILFPSNLSHSVPHETQKNPYVLSLDAYVNPHNSQMNRDKESTLACLLRLAVRPY